MQMLIIMPNDIDTHGTGWDQATALGHFFVSPSAVWQIGLGDRKDFRTITTLNNPRLLCLCSLLEQKNNCGFHLRPNTGVHLKNCHENGRSSNHGIEDNVAIVGTAAIRRSILAPTVLTHGHLWCRTVMTVCLLVQQSGRWICDSTVMGSTLALSGNNLRQVVCTCASVTKQ